MSLSDLRALSNRYGGNPDYVLGGGGNTSFKEKGILYVKASGQRLSDMTEEGFVAMEVEKLRAIAAREYAGTDKEVEAAVLADMMAARLPGEDKRPSVEAAVHALMEGAYVLHIHPNLLNGITCARQGEVTLKVMLQGLALWIPEIKPGYTLAHKAAADLAKFKEEHGAPCQIMFLQNHGVFFTADTVEEIDRLTAALFGAFGRFSPILPSAEPISQTSPLAETLSALSDGKTVLFEASDLLTAGLEADYFEKLPTFTPDHMVYCGHKFLLTTPEGLAADYSAFAASEGFAPKVVGVKGVGAFAIGESDYKAGLILALLKDAIKIALYAEGSGGPRFQSSFLVNFIRNWEVETYRAGAISDK